MLTNTASAERSDDTAITATTIAIEDAERRCHAALRDIARLLEAAQISDREAADLDAETIARFTAAARELQLRGEAIIDPRQWARYEARAARRRADAIADRRRSPRLRRLSAPARMLRERQMCVVATAHVSSDVLRWLRLDDDEETLATRRELVAAGLL